MMSVCAVSLCDVIALSHVCWSATKRKAETFSAESVLRYVYVDLDSLYSYYSYKKLIKPKNNNIILSDMYLSYPQV